MEVSINLKRIRKIKYSLYDNNEISNFPVEVNQPNSKNENTMKSTNSGALGSINNNKCLSCESVEPKCSGHFGYVKMMEGMCVPNPDYINYIIEVANMCCIYCQFTKSPSIHVNEFDEIMKNENEKRKREYGKFCKEECLKRINKKCFRDECNKPYVKIVYTKMNTIMYKVPGEDEKKLTYAVIYSLLRSLDPLIVKYVFDIHIGLEKLFFVHSFIIPSNIIRPKQYYPGSDIKQEINPLTSVLNKLTQLNNLKESERESAASNTLYDLYYGISINTKKTLDNNYGSPCGNKEGLLRKDILGRRKDRGGRLILGPHRLPFHIISLPEIAAKIITTKVYVNYFTIEKIKELFFDFKLKTYYNSQHDYSVLINANNKFQTSFDFMPGDYVTLTLSDYLSKFNTPLMLNYGRQPSLHKTNLMSNKIVINYNKTVTVSTGIIGSFNGDFDGDSLHFNLLTDPISRVEQVCLMYTPRMIISEGLSLPMYYLIQDQLSQMYKLYLEENISYDNALKILNEKAYLIEDYNTKTIFRGRDICNLFLPSNMKKKYIKNKNGFMIDKLEPKYISSKSKESLTLLVYDYYNDVKACEFIHNYIILVNNYLMLKGFSIKYKDVYYDLEKHSLLNNKIKLYINDVDKRISKYVQKYKKIYNIKVDKNYMFKNLGELLKPLDTECLSIILDALKDSAIKTLYDVGFKINKEEIVKIYCYMGMHKIDKKIIANTIGNKTNIYSLPGAYNLTSKGFVMNNLISGVDINDLHMMAHEAKQKLLSITCMTSMVGTTENQLKKTNEDVITDNYGFVVNQNVVFYYGLNYIKLPGNIIRYIPIIKPFKELIWYEEINDIYLSQIYKCNISLYKDSMYDTLAFPIDIELYISSYQDYDISTTDELIYMEKSLHLFKSMKDKDLSNDDLYSMIDKFMKKLFTEYFFELQNLDSLKYTLITYLNPTRIKSTENLIKFIFDAIIFLYTIYPDSGYPIGIITTQTQTETLTQSSLSQFHKFSEGGSVKAVPNDYTLYRSITNLSNKDNPHLTILISEDKSKLEKIQNELEFITLYYLNAKYKWYDDNNFDISINRNNFIKYNINEMQCYFMIKYILTIISVVSEFNIRIDFENDNIIYKMYIRYPYPERINKLILQMSLNAFYKGKLSDNGLPIQEKKIYKDGKEVNSYRIIMDLDKVESLGAFDTEGVDIIFDHFLTNSLFGIVACEDYISAALYSTFPGSTEAMYLCCNLTAKSITQIPSLQSIKKSKLSYTSTIKNISFGQKGVKDFPKSVVKGRVDNTNDFTSSLVFSNILKVGTGYNKIMIDINQYKILKSAQEKIEIEKKNVKKKKWVM
jgi:DNA-directed RNA polymerase beta' subunit